MNASPTSNNVEFTPKLVNALSLLHDHNNLLIDDYCRTLSDIISYLVCEINLKAPLPNDFKLHHFAVQLSYLRETLTTLEKPKN